MYITGDCVGADKQFHLICQQCRAENTATIVIHPPADPSKRAFCSGAHRICALKSYLERNHDIVDAVDILIAAPRGFKEELRSGTWATIRYARKQGKTIFIVFPDGTIK